MTGPSAGLSLYRRSLLHIWFTSILALTSTGRGIALISASTHQRTGAAIARGGSTLVQHVSIDAGDQESVSNSNNNKSATSYLSAGQVIMGDPSEVRTPNYVRYSAVPFFGRDQRRTLLYVARILCCSQFPRCINIIVLLEPWSTQSPVPLGRYGRWSPCFG
jgi:hypothetical protein